MAYFHGVLVKDEWTKIDKIGIPINVLFIADMLFIGYQSNFWMINLEVDEEKPTHYLINIASLSNDIGIYENLKILRKLIRGRKLNTLSSNILDSLRKSLKVQLLSEYID